MILYYAAKNILFRQIGPLIYFSSHLNKTHGSIHKPLNQFGQNTKFIDPNIEKIKQQPPTEEIKQNKTAETISPQGYVEDGERNRENSFKQKLNREFAFFFSLNEEEKLNTIEEYRQKEMIKELSIICREMYYYNVKSYVVWSSMEDAFGSFLHAPYDQEKIRSLSKFLDALGKSKRVTKNYEKQMSQILPQSSLQSFTQIVGIMSKMGTMSESFLQHIQKIYWKRKDEFQPLQLNLINYAFAKHGKSIDTSLIDKIESFPLRGIVVLLKTYNRAGLITPSVLKKCIQPILSHRGETSFFDLKHLVNIYLKYQYFDNYHLLHYFDEQYRSLESSINEQTLLQIWQYFPDAVNKNKLPPTFVQQVIKSLKVLRKRNKLSERAWKKISMTFSKFTNPQIKEDLEKLSTK